MFKFRVNPALYFATGCKTYEVSANVTALFSIMPILILLLFGVAWFTPDTHTLATWFSKENGPAELLTFLFLFFGSIIAFALALRLKSEGEKRIIWSFLMLFSGALLFVALEEISWGQQFFEFETPETFKVINTQNEFSFHNIQGLHGNSEYFHLFFGLAGLAGIKFYPYSFQKIKTPYLLKGILILIVVIAIFDLSNDFISYQKSIPYFTRRLSEINEMFIGFTGFCYSCMLTRALSKEHDPVVLAIPEPELQNSQPVTEQLVNGVKV